MRTDSMAKRKNQPPKSERLKPISMYGVSVDDALKAAMQTPPMPKQTRQAKRKKKAGKKKGYCSIIRLLIGGSSPVAPFSSSASHS